ncbi:Neuropeptide-like peptide 11 [Caenorhabditis elegans]|uniref:Neuropeptide-like peptide 11 n=1 Tax=Caenorhabditis elegans TaxID=6239 RepID=NLP11_CAEEL|nr:Neuropeptide-like peptide 11 [Caenorhabditis elegans]Q09367.1 RecName: Full=Neuropeptide-like peptide 11; Flags: Precursor [Caenorhabditis elegans]CAA87048.1 Neuropeptide-like peptide 11 [Caenorhabditis elegans]|eukprot:NP_496091.1 Neuropeptide-like peptide 11 [Caenorhabditis elegans]
MMSTLALVSLAIFGIAVVCAAPKPATVPVANEEDYLAALYGFEAPGSQFKGAPLQSKRHISPSYDVEIDAGNMRNLLDIGKRSAPMASDYGNQFQMYNRLIDAGKKKRSPAISPAYQFENAFGLSEALERAGRR